MGRMSRSIGSPRRPSGFLRTELGRRIMDHYGKRARARLPSPAPSARRLGPRSAMLLSLPSMSTAERKEYLVDAFHKAFEYWQETGDPFAFDTLRADLVEQVLLARVLTPEDLDTLVLRLTRCAFDEDQRRYRSGVAQ